MTWLSPRFVVRAVVELACLAVPTGGVAFAADTPKRPVNLLLIMTDQQRFDALGCAGNKVIKTPNLDRLAREGVRFENAYTSCPVCVPARTVILTGHSIESVRVANNKDIRRTDVKLARAQGRMAAITRRRGSSKSWRGCPSNDSWTSACFSPWV